MKHVVVLAPGDEVELHWQQDNFQPTVCDVFMKPLAHYADEYDARNGQPSWYGWILRTAAMLIRSHAT